MRLFFLAALSWALPFGASPTCGAERLRVIQCCLLVGGSWAESLTQCFEVGDQKPQLRNVSKKPVNGF